MRTLQEIFDSLPKIECKGICYDACGSISIEQAETDLIKEYLAKQGKEFIPFPTYLDALAKATEHTNEHHPSCICMYCPYLLERKCTIYDVRPLICRLWGVAEGLRCTWGCKVVGKLLTRKEAYALLDEVSRIGKPVPTEL